MLQRGGIGKGEFGGQHNRRARGRGVGVKRIDGADETRQGGNDMSYIGKVWAGFYASKTGQTMTEYVLIIAAIAVAGYIAYQGLEGGINTIISNVTATLKGA